jgi:hypothetical protein
VGETGKRRKKESRIKKKMYDCMIAWMHERAERGERSAERQKIKE